MPLNYEMPRWVGQPADPAAHYATGMQIGMRLGAEQAANQYRQQQLLMEQQKMAFEQQYAQQKQALEIGEIVQKQRAAAAYQGMVSQGVNPMQALAVTGLSMGMDPDRLASIQANQEYRRAQLSATQEDRAARRAFQREQQTFRETQAEKPKPYVAEREREALAQLQQQASDIESALKSDPNNPTLKSRQQDVLNRIQIWGTQHPGGQQLTLSTGDVNVTLGPVGAGKTAPGAQSDIQKQLANIKTSVLQASSAKNALTANDVGIAGVLTDSVLNKYVAQFVPEISKPEVAGHRVQLEKAVDNYIGSLSSKGMRLSAPERQAIRDGLISMGMGEAAPRSMGVLDAIQKVQRLEAIANSKSIKAPLEPWMFVGLTQDDILNLFDQKIISQPELETWILKAEKGGITGSGLEKLKVIRTHGK